MHQFLERAVNKQKRIFIHTAKRRKANGLKHDCATTLKVGVMGEIRMREQGKGGRWSKNQVRNVEKKKRGK